jgi:prepilin-type N-terminal cleavage/methylation domain-containing protein
MPNTSWRRDPGLTLVELLVVLVVISSLASIAITVFLRQRDRAYDAAVAADLRNAAIAQEAVLSAGGAYAQDQVQLAAVGYRPSPARNYAAGPVLMTVHGQASQGFCLTARSASGRYVAMASDLGLVVRETAPDPTTCR